MCSLGFNWKHSSIGSNNGLAPNRRQAIIWANVDMMYWRIYASLCLRWQKMISPSNWPFLKKSLHLNDNTCLCSIIQASKLVFGSLLAKNNFFVQFWTKNFASSRMADCGSGLPAEWPFRSQNAIEASDSPLPGGLWVKSLITHALCSLAYSVIAWCKLFMILTMKGLY